MIAICYELRLKCKPKHIPDSDKKINNANTHLFKSDSLQVHNKVTAIGYCTCKSAQAEKFEIGGGCFSMCLSFFPFTTLLF